MSHLNKDKLLKWLDTESYKYSPFRTEYTKILAIFKEINSGRFDDYSAINAVALLDELEIKLNEANRRIKELEAERELMKGALEAIRDFKQGKALIYVYTLKEIARKALEGEPAHENR
jgi:hypothetical protein